MATSTALTETKRKLERLAVDARRSKSFLAAKAVSACIEREIEIIDSIRRGMCDVEAARVVPHDEAMRELQAVIDAAERGKVRRSRCRGAGGPGRSTTPPS